MRQGRNPGWSGSLAVALLLAGCGGLAGPTDLSDPGPTIPPATGDGGWDDDDATPDDDDATPDDDDVTLDDDDAGPDGPVAPCGPWVEPGQPGQPVSTSSGEALLTPPDTGSTWSGCEVRRVFGADGGFVCEDWWQVTGERTFGAPDGDVYRLTFDWVEGLSSCPDGGADFVIRYAVQPLPDQELNLYRSEPLGEPLWLWVTRGTWALEEEGGLGIGYRTGFTAL